MSFANIEKQDQDFKIVCYSRLEELLGFTLVEKIKRDWLISVFKWRQYLDGCIAGYNKSDDSEFVILVWVDEGSDRFHAKTAYTRQVTRDSFIS